MARTLTVLIPPALVLLGLVAVGEPPAAAVGVPRPEAAVLLERGPTPEAPHPEQGPEPTPAADPFRVEGLDSPATARERALSVLDDLRDWVSRDIDATPEPLIRDVVAILERQPELAEELLAGLGPSERRVWRLLGKAVLVLDDATVRNRLIERHRAADPWRSRLEEAWSDPALLVETLRADGESDFRVRVLDGIPDELMAREEILGEVRALAEHGTDAGLRAHAILRVSRSRAPGSTGLLVRIVENGRLPLPDRQTAAMALARVTEPEVADLWLRLLERRDHVSLLMHAVRGLAAHIRRPGITEALLAEIESEANPEELRERAGSSLARAVYDLDQAERVPVLDRIRDVVRGLRSSGENAGLLAHLEGRFRRHWERTGSASEAAAVLMTR